MWGLVDRKLGFEVQMGIRHLLKGIKGIKKKTVTFKCKTGIFSFGLFREKHRVVEKAAA